MICWPISNVRGYLSLRVKQLNVDVETKTKDNVFIRVTVSVQYKIISTKAKEAFYKLTDPASQITSYVFDSVRATCPKLELDEAFASKEEVAHGVKNHLSHEMASFGYEIVQTLVTDLTPNDKVKASMNEINANRRLKEAAQHKAEAEKISVVKAAEADAESKYLSGLGVAKQRKAIVSGLQSSVKEFQESVDGTTATDVMTLLMMTQYFDMLQSVGCQQKTTTVFSPSNTGGTNVREAMMEAQAGRL
jgi:regulator of protease activity HflC (stomatin/prohibitin superfamily)